MKIGRELCIVADQVVMHSFNPYFTILATEYRRRHHFVTAWIRHGSHCKLLLLITIVLVAIACPTNVRATIIYNGCDTFTQAGYIITDGPYVTPLSQIYTEGGPGGQLSYEVRMQYEVRYPGNSFYRGTCQVRDSGPLGSSKESYRQAAEDADRVRDAAELVSCAASPVVCAAGLNLSSDTLRDSTGNLTLIADIVEVIGSLAGPLGFWGPAVTSVTMVIGGFADYMWKESVRLSLDPPDPDFLTVYQHSGQTVEWNTGLDQAANNYLSDTYNLLFQLTEAREGELRSIERAQGALLAGNIAIFPQIESANYFTSEYALLAPLVGERLLGVPELLISRGQLDPSVQGAPSFFQVLNDWGSSLGATRAAPIPDPSPVTSVPEPSTLGLLGLGLAGLVALRRFSG